MVGFQHGDEEAFVTLYRRYRDRIINFCRRLVGSQALGEEAAQETFLRLYRARARYRPESQFSTYLYRIAKNLCLNLRHRREHALLVRDRPVDGEPATAAAQDSLTHNKQVRMAINQALSSLPDKQAAAFVLCHHEGLSLKEASEVMGLSEGAIKSLVFRARAALVTRLEPWLGEQQGVATDEVH
jgi:RNA polymerase sigma-70 factor (ECF subfamily)